MLHISTIPGGMRSGLSIDIKGEALPEAKVFVVNLQTGEGTDVPYIPYHNSVRINTGILVRNNRVNNVWGKEEKDGTLSIRQGRVFSINISAKDDKYVMYVDGNFFSDFVHRVPMTQATHLCIYGDCSLESVTFKARESTELNFVTITTEYLYSEV